MNSDEVKGLLRIELNVQEKHIKNFDRDLDPYSYGYAEGWLMCLRHCVDFLEEIDEQQITLEEIKARLSWLEDRLDRVHEV